MSRPSLISLAACVLLTGCQSDAPPGQGEAPTASASRSAAAQSAVAPVQELGCMAVSAAGQTGDGLYGMSGDRLEAWVWHGATMAKGEAADLPPGIYNVRPVPKNRYLCITYGRDLNTAILALRPLNTQDEVKSWPPPQGWSFEWTPGVSINGRYAAAMLEGRMDRRNPRFRVGLIDLETLELRWVGELSGRGSATIRRIAVSDDGKYVAVGGWANGVALVDASQRKVLWEGRPPTEVSTGYVMFSSDGLTLYSAGSEGCVYVTDTRTGEITGRWWATETGRSRYGHRVSDLTKSPDGRWVAAGTGPEGYVYVFSTTAAVKPQRLVHGGGTVMAVSFSPDSKHLASMAAGSIKVWPIGDLAPKARQKTPDSPGHP